MMTSGSTRRSSAEQELAEQWVIAVPLAPPIERNQEQTRGLEFAQPLLPARFLEEGIAQRTRQLIEDRGAPQELLKTRGQLHQRLAVEVVGHVPIVTGNGQRLTVTVARDQRSEVDADRPALGPFGDGDSQLTSKAYVCLREDLLGAGRVQGQVVRT